MSVSSAAPTFKVPLTQEEKSLYSQVFKSLDPENSGVITGEKARSTFEKSGLPPTILGEIWQLADQNNLGFLTQFGFCYAMRLIGYTQAGYHPSAGLADTPGPLPKFANLNLPSRIPSQNTSNSFLPSHTGSTPLQQQQQQQPPQPSGASDSVGPVSPNDYNKFAQLFVKTTGSPTAELGGAQARDIFMKAKLPTATLGQIWSLVDRYNTGKLDVGAFAISMHLIQGLLSGQIRQLPAYLPESVWQSVQNASSNISAIPSVPSTSPTQNRQTSYGSVSSQQTTVRHPSGASRDVSGSSPSDWVASPAVKQQYEAIFNNLDKSKSGQLNPNQVASFLMTSKLGEQDLATIWDLADIQNTGIFTPLEFSIALFLVNRKLAGGKLPNIVPHSLVESLKESPQARPVQKAVSTGSQPISSASTEIPQQQQSNFQIPAKPKSAMDDLVDIFGSSAPSPVPAATSLTPSEIATPPKVQPRSTSSDLTPSSAEVPRTLTGSFRPTSNFGQSLMHKQTLISPREEKDQESLLGDDVDNSVEKSTTTSTPLESTSSPVSFQAQAATPIKEQKFINYDALRSVPPPPPKKTTTPAVVERSSSAQAFPEPQQQSFQQSQSQQTTGQQRSLQQPSFGQQQQYNQPQNDDLLADSNPEISGQLSQATSDIANVSNQIKSLATQTTSLHEKKTRAEQELQRILNTKAEIDNKLKQLRSSYQNEVKQVEQVETSLAAAKEETEALRSEASISEAKFNTLSTELNEKQVAMEELQKQNNTLKEKLGYLNAEIVELQKSSEAKSAENVRLTNQVAVKKSQVQVAIVKIEELKSKINQLEASNKQLQLELDNSEQQRRNAEAEQQSLSARAREIGQNKPTKHSLPSLTTGLAAGGIIGATAGGIAALAHHKSEGTSSIRENNDVNVTPALPQSAAVSGHELSSPIETTKKDIPILADKVKEEPSDTFSTSQDNSNFDNDDDGFPEPNIDEEENDQETTRGLVHGNDENDINSRFPDLSVNERGPVDNVTNATANSSITTDYKNLDEGETPVTSPSNSDFQFPQGGNAGIVGGLVGMPGVLVGVQRTDSLTSSVVNNAALSVRDDNIDEISDRETIDNDGNLGSEETVPNTAGTENFESDVLNENSQLVNEEASDGDKVSSGVESFEIVNAEDAKSHEPLQSSSQSKELEDDNVSSSDGNQGSVSRQIDNEFPPIRELDYDDEDSSDSASQSDKFDDAVDDLPHSTSRDLTSHPETESAPPFDDFDKEFDDLEPAAEAHAGEDKSVVQQSTPFDEFDNGFDDLEPTTAETSGAQGHVAQIPKEQDLFADEFNNLEDAPVEDDGDEDFNDNGFGFSNDFTNAEDNGSHSRAPDFSTSSTVAQTNTGNDEWEQLFAGFGNAAPGSTPVPDFTPSHSQTPTAPSLTASSLPPKVTATQDGSIQELVGMGFDEKTAVEALEKQGWDLEAATNFLLDNA
ncbi:uncharacterized protein RJT20DRAFT_128858 [Scheffersomyces xylosifermentans]|uniref:uncharacterized protein n=1 Tax=Scheffersomyces xylosifermentans TaxID=1304137 RepID=UPI00315C61F6